MPNDQDQYICGITKEIEIHNCNTQCVKGNILDIKSLCDTADGSSMHLHTWVFHLSSWALMLTQLQMTPSFHWRELVYLSRLCDLSISKDESQLVSHSHFLLQKKHKYI